MRGYGGISIEKQRGLVAVCLALQINPHLLRCGDASSWEKPLQRIEAKRREQGERIPKNRVPQVGKETQGNKKKNQVKKPLRTFLIKAPSLRSTRGYIAIPGTGFRAGMGTGPLGVMALGFMGLGPGAGPRRALPAWLAELDRGRPPIWGGGAICGPPP
jgi:hypothetical protein